MDVNKEGVDYVGNDFSRYFIILFLSTCNYKSWSEMATIII